MVNVSTTVTANDSAGIDRIEHTECTTHIERTAHRECTERTERTIDSALAGLSVNSRVVYRARIDAFRAWCGSDRSDGTNRALTRESVQRYLATLPEPSVINQTLSALKRLAVDAAESGRLDWSEAVAIGRIKGKRVLGVRTGNWLTREQTAQLLALPDRATRAGKRDYVMLALLFGCGLRRAEVCNLRMDNLQ
jgi:site-specific recombinase XerD